MTQYAAHDEVSSLAEEMPDSFLLCREIGHNWRPHTAQLVSDDHGESMYERTLRCSRCKTVRRQTLSLAGTILSSAYDYADGYQLHGVGRIIGEARDALRLASVTRYLQQQSNGKSRSR